MPSVQTLYVCVVDQSQPPARLLPEGRKRSWAIVPGTNTIDGASFLSSPRHHHPFPALFRSHGSRRIGIPVVGITRPAPLDLRLSKLPSDARRYLTIALVVSIITLPYLPTNTTYISCSGVAGQVVVREKKRNISSQAREYWGQFTYTIVSRSIGDDRGCDAAISSRAAHYTIYIASAFDADETSVRAGVLCRMGDLVLISGPNLTLLSIARLARQLPIHVTSLHPTQAQGI